MVTILMLLAPGCCTVIGGFTHQPSLIQRPFVNKPTSNYPNLGVSPVSFWKPNGTKSSEFKNLHVPIHLVSLSHTQEVMVLLSYVVDGRPSCLSHGFSAPPGFSPLGIFSGSPIP